MAMLTAQRVDELFRYCLFKAGQDPQNALRVEGILREYFVLHGARVQESREHIEALLAELPLEFQQFHGGGWAFTFVGHDRVGYVWTRQEHIKERLVVLGLAIDRIQFLALREKWKDCRGGPPFLVRS